MTIANYVSNFLKLYESLKIDTNYLEVGSDKYGLFKSPARTSTPFIESAFSVTENFVFYASQASISEIERKEDEEWLEDFIYWIDDFNYNYDYPPIDKGRRVTNISVNGSYTPYVNDDNGIIYQFNLSITYEREVKEHG